MHGKAERRKREVGLHLALRVCVWALSQVSVRAGGCLHVYSSSRFRSPVGSIHQAPSASVNTLKLVSGAPDITRSKMSPPQQGSGTPYNACVPMGWDSANVKPADGRHDCDRYAFLNGVLLRKKAPHAGR